MIIKKQNYKVVVNNLKKNWFEIKRISRDRVITTYAREKEVSDKISLLSLPLNLLKKEIQIL